MNTINPSVHPEPFVSEPLRVSTLRVNGVEGASARGMTLIEIMVVIVILGMIAAAVAVNVVGAKGKAELQQARTDVQHIADQGVDAFRVMKGRYPTTEEGIRILLDEKFLKPNKPDGSLQDPWSNPYVYTNPGQKHADGYDVRSNGPDGRSGTEDDIVNF